MKILFSQASSAGAGGGAGNLTGNPRQRWGCRRSPWHQPCAGAGLSCTVPMGTATPERHTAAPAPCSRSGSLQASFFPALGLVFSLSKQTFRLPAACWRSPLSQPRACSGSVGSWRQHGLVTAAGPGVAGEPVLKGELVLVSFVSVAGGWGCGCSGVGPCRHPACFPSSRPFFQARSAVPGS